MSNVYGGSLGTCARRFTPSQNAEVFINLKSRVGITETERADARSM